MTENKEEKWMHYANKITTTVIEMLQEDEDFRKELEENPEENVPSFLFAFSVASPTLLLDMFTGTKMDYLEFNHLSNRLVFQFAKMSEAEPLVENQQTEEDVPQTNGPGPQA